MTLFGKLKSTISVTTSNIAINSFVCLFSSMITLAIVLLVRYQQKYHQKIKKMSNWSTLPDCHLMNFANFEKKAACKCTSIFELYFKNNLITQIATQRLTTGERQPYRF
jgi:hypothetical protein